MTARNSYQIILGHGVEAVLQMPSGWGVEEWKKVMAWMAFSAPTLMPGVSPKETACFGFRIVRRDWMPGFAAYQPGSEGALATLFLNVGSLLATVETGELAQADLPRAIAKSLMHEIIHRLEEWAGVEFSEERVEKLLEAYRGEGP